jgi:hypothetical protein
MHLSGDCAGHGMRQSKKNSDSSETTGSAFRGEMIHALSKVIPCRQFAASYTSSDVSVCEQVE